MRRIMKLLKFTQFIVFFSPSKTLYLRISLSFCIIFLHKDFLYRLIQLSLFIKQIQIQMKY
jgi:hypothetical protein